MGNLPAVDVKRHHTWSHCLGRRLNRSHYGDWRSLPMSIRCFDSLWAYLRRRLRTSDADCNIWKQSNTSAGTGILLGETISLELLGRDCPVGCAKSAMCFRIASIWSCTWRCGPARLAAFRKSWYNQMCWDAVAAILSSDSKMPASTGQYGSQCGSITMRYSIIRCHVKVGGIKVDGIKVGPYGPIFIPPTFIPPTFTWLLIIHSPKIIIGLWISEKLIHSNVLRCSCRYSKFRFEDASFYRTVWQPMW